LEVIEREFEISAIAQTTNEKIVIETIKKAYRGDAIVIRMSESQGQMEHCGLKTVFAFEKAFETTLMEEIIKECDLLNLHFAPYEIKTIKLELIR